MFTAPCSIAIHLAFDYFHPTSSAPTHIGFGLVFWPYASVALVELPQPGKLVVATPEQPDVRPTSGTLQIPARLAAVVMEQ